MKMHYFSSLWIIVLMGILGTIGMIILSIIHRKERPDIKFLTLYILFLTIIFFLAAMVESFMIWEELKTFLSIMLGLSYPLFMLGMTLNLIYPVKKGTCQPWVLIFVICMTIISVVHYFLNGRPYEFYTP